MSINHVCISGNLTRDPELRATNGGTSVLQFGMAVNDRRQNPQTQQWEDYPNFVDVSVFGNRAQSLSSILRKGMKVTVDGKLRYSSWESNGQRRSKLEVIANEIDLPPRGSQQQSYGGGYQQQAQQPVAAQPQQGYQQQGYAAATPPAPAAPAPVAPPAPQQTQIWSGRQQPPRHDVYDEDIPF